MDKGTEYAFTRKDGKIRYEIVFERKEIFVFMRLHDAIRAVPVCNNQSPMED